MTHTRFAHRDYREYLCDTCEQRIGHLGVVKLPTNPADNVPLRAWCPTHTPRPLNSQEVIGRFTT